MFNFSVKKATNLWSKYNTFASLGGIRPGIDLFVLQVL